LKRAKRAPRPSKFVFTVQEVADRLDTSWEHVSGLIDSGEILAFNVAGVGSTREVWRIPREALEKFIAKRSNTGGAA